MLVQNKLLVDLIKYFKKGSNVGKLRMTIGIFNTLILWIHFFNIDNILYCGVIIQNYVFSMMPIKCQKDIVILSKTSFSYKVFILAELRWGE